MSNNTPLITSRPRNESPEALTSLVNISYRALRMFIASYMPSVALLDVADMDVWNELRAKHNSCPVDATATIWAHMIAIDVMRKVLTQEESRTVSEKDALGYAMVQESLRALKKPDCADNLVAIKVETRFALLPADQSSKQTRRAAGESHEALAQGVRDGAFGVAAALCAARSSLMSSEASIPPAPERHLLVIIERLVDGVLSADDRRSLEEELAKNLLLPAILTIQMRAHLILKALITSTVPPMTAVVDRVAAASSKPRDRSPRTTATSSPRLQSNRYTTGTATLHDRIPGQGNVVAIIGITTAFVLAGVCSAYVIMGRSHEGNRVVTPGAPISASTPAPTPISTTPPVAVSSLITKSSPSPVVSSPISIREDASAKILPRSTDGSQRREPMLPNGPSRALGTGHVVIAIACAGTPVGAFLADQDFTGGTEWHSREEVRTAGVSNVAPEVVYQYERWGADMVYTIPGLVPGARYSVRLHFCEISKHKLGERVFDILINGIVVLKRLDIVAAAGGPRIAMVRDFPATATATGQLTISFAAVLDNPKLSGLEIISATP